MRAKTMWDSVNIVFTQELWERRVTQGNTCHAREHRFTISQRFDIRLCNEFSRLMEHVYAPVSQRYSMSLPGLHALARNGPCLLIEVDFIPCGFSDFTRSYRSQHQELTCKLGEYSSISFPHDLISPRQHLDTRQRSMMLHLRPIPRQDSFQCVYRIVLTMLSSNRMVELRLHTLNAVSLLVCHIV